MHLFIYFKKRVLFAVTDCSIREYRSILVEYLPIMRALRQHNTYAKRIPSTR